MKYLVLVLTVLFGLIAFSKDEGLVTMNPISKAGEIFNVKIVPGDKNMKIFLTGNEMADLTVTETGLEVYVRVGDKMKKLGTKKEGEYFIVNEKMQKPSTLILNVKSKDKKEKIEVPLH